MSMDSEQKQNFTSTSEGQFVSLADPYVIK